MKKMMFSFAFLFSILSCSQLYTAVPYLISGEMRINEEGKKEMSSFAFKFKNCSEKDVFSFTVSFFLFDEDGNPVMNGSPKISCIIREDILSGDTLDSSYSLDDFLNFIPENPYKVEYLYVSKIIYSDGTEWSDTLGLKAVKERK